VLIASRLTCEASGRHTGDPDVSEVCCLHLQWSSSPTRAARPTQCHITEDLLNFSYFLMEGSTLCFIYRLSQLHLRTTVNGSVGLTECGWAHSAARLKCFLANCGVAQTGHPPYSLDLISAHVCFLWTKTRPQQISGCDSIKENLTAEINAVHVDVLDDRFVTFRKMQQDCT